MSEHTDDREYPEETTHITAGWILAVAIWAVISLSIVALGYAEGSPLLCLFGVVLFYVAYRKPGASENQNPVGKSPMSRVSEMTDLEYSHLPGNINHQRYLEHTGQKPLYTPPD